MTSIFTTSTTTDLNFMPSFKLETELVCLPNIPSTKNDARKGEQCQDDRSDHDQDPDSPDNVHFSLKMICIMRFIQVCTR